jgi:putative ABC transport system substrate-binding protein
MRRREFLGLVIAGATALALRAQAKAETRHRIAILSGGSPSGNESNWEAFRQGMAALGYGDQELVIESRWAEGHYERLPTLAAELVQLAPDVIVTGSNATALAAKQATATIPIVAAFTANPVRSGLAASLARPGGNVTGLSNILEDLAGKQLELLHTAAPHATHIAVLSDPGNPSHATEWRGAQEAARPLAVAVFLLEARTQDEIENAFTDMTAGSADALIVLGDAFFFAEASRIADRAAREKLPAIYAVREHVAAGGLMSYGPDIRDNFRRAAVYVDKIFKGAKPADLPFEQPTKLELVINLKTAKTLGLALPKSNGSTLARATFTRCAAGSATRSRWRC